MLEQLKQKFLSSFEEKISTLETALERQDVQALTVQVHQLAGSSGSYGFAEISAMCSEIEMLAQEQEDMSALLVNKSHELIKLLEQCKTG